MSSFGPFYLTEPKIQGSVDGKKVEYKVTTTNESTIQISADVRVFASIGRTMLLDETIEELMTPDEQLEISGSFNHQGSSGDEIQLCARIKDEEEIGVG